MVKQLFEPINLGTMRLPNRVIMTSMHLGMADENGRVTQQMIDLYVERARNSVGLIISGVSFLHPSHRGYLGLEHMIGLHDDDCLQGMSELTQALQGFGTKFCVQLSHPGAHAYSRFSGVQARSPSGLTSEITRESTQELSLEDIEKIIDQFSKAAIMAKKAGVGAVEILCGKGLVGQFLSPFTNRRKDKYGGDLQGRMRFALEVLKGIKERLGKDYPVLYRILAHDFFGGSRTREEAYVFARSLEDQGVDGLDVTVESHAAVVPRDTMEVPPGVFLYLAQGLKSAVNVPVIGNVRLNDPFQAEEALREAKIDLAGMARALLADPEFLVKAAEGRCDEIRKCIGCCQGCLGMITQGKPVTCLVNPQAGREGEYRIRPATQRKKVVVVGGGPGGMEAAWVLAQRGHETLLFEENDRLGGRLQEAKIPPGRKDFGNFIDYLSRELPRLSVKVALGRKMTSDSLLTENPDAVVIATGGIPLIPDIPGVQNDHVHTAEAVLSGQAEPGRHVIVIGGGGVGCETALFIAKKGLPTTEQLQFLDEWGAMDYGKAIELSSADRSVTLFEMVDEIGIDLESHTRTFVLAAMTKYRVKVLTQAKVVEIAGNGVYYLHDDKERRFFPCDTVVLATGYRSNNQLFNEIRSQIKEVYCHGDCVEPRTALEAIHEGYEVGMKI